MVSSLKMGKQRSGYSNKRKFSGSQSSGRSKCLKTSETSTASASDENVSKSGSEDQAAKTKLVQLIKQVFLPGINVN